jgi:hypothetical protein
MYFVVLTWASLVGHCYVSIYVTYMCMSTFLFTSFSFKNIVYSQHECRFVLFSTMLFYKGSNV